MSPVTHKNEMIYHGDHREHGGTKKLGRCFWILRALCVLRGGPRICSSATCGQRPVGLACWAEVGCVVFSLGYVLIMSGLAFGGAVTLVGFGGLLFTSFHRAMGSPLPLPTLHNAFERRLYVLVGLIGVVMWGSAMLCSWNFTP